MKAFCTEFVRGPHCLLADRGNRLITLIPSGRVA